MIAAFLFPGQGSQRVGMGRELVAASAAARATMAEVDEALGQHLSRLIADGPEAELTLTTNAQPALLAVAIASIRALESTAERPFADFARLCAGHSLGEYAALTAAGTFDLASAARLLRLRGEAMQEAVPFGAGAMAAILGLDVDAVEQVVAEVGGEVDVANDNADGQVVISGAKPAVQAAVAAAKAAGAKRAMELPVSAPFHCRLMQPAAAQMAAALATVPMADARVPVIANTLATPVTDAAVIRSQLVAQVTGRVRWRETMQALRGAEVGLVVEAGAGKVLAGLAKRGVPGATISGLETPADVETVAGLLRGS